MAEAQIQYSTDKATAYRELAVEVASVVKGETSRTARYATTVSLLVSAFGGRFFWCGFYEVDPLKGHELVVGPYQGTLGCMRIAFGKGVCGAAAAKRETIIVPDVHAFPGHIAC
ncbi:MAG TPA: GAF domain-containing protein, partial [Hyphomonadaceae bacterium]|nr:GAF domain-containing protein [Hyphomonadaceae bacterium]